MSTYGAPETVTTDRGRQFTSNHWKNTLHTLGTNIKTTTAYHPQANDMVERFHRQLKSSLKARGGDWFQELPIVLLAIRTTPREDLGATPAELLYGTTLRLPGDMVLGARPCTEPDIHIRKLRAGMKRLANVPPVYHDRPAAYLQPKLATAKLVYDYVGRDAVRGPLDPMFDGPFLVIAPGDKNFLIERNNRAERISIDRLKVAYTEPRSVSATR